MAPLTQVISETWNVVVGKEIFSLDEKQIQVLKEATLEGSRSLVWFGDFAISIPHIQVIYLVERKHQQPLGIESGSLEISEEQMKRNRERIAEIKKSLGSKFGGSKHE